jgi:hypothetical protein
MMRIYILAFLLAFFSSCSPELPDDVAEQYSQLKEELDYNIDVKPILSDKCFACHGPDQAKQEAGLRLDIPEQAFNELPENKGKFAISPGSLKGSELFHRIISDDPDYMMPTPDSHLSLTPKEKAVLIKWIKEGAVYQPHWALKKPEMPKIPKVGKSEVAHNPIDNFILEKLKSEKLAPSGLADKEILLRRLSLDLTGLPPTLEEIDAFVKDQATDAYEKQVDRLLKSPHYGEKMAVDWLDLARFADSHGYTVDRLRDMSPYRDWVINSFNQNFPYDKFIHWQLAGDLMPGANKDMLIATAFNRNHQQNMEGGIVEEEFQTEYVVDRTNTFGDAFLGISVGCAKCHDHKYDPISQKNYYELYSFFSNIQEAGQISFDNTAPAPTLQLPSKEKEAIVKYINQHINQQEKQVALEKGTMEAEFNKWIQTGAYRKLADKSIPSYGLQGSFKLDQKSLRNELNSTGSAVMKRESGQPGDAPVFIEGKSGEALLLDGDTWLDLNQVGAFRRSDPFSIGIWVTIPKGFTEGVIFHKSIAERLYNFKGYHLYMKQNRLELSMSHAYPSNAITKLSEANIPRDKWIQLTMTYDGSSKASGLKLYLDGSELPMEITMDQLEKDILFKSNPEPGLQIGAWWRGSGFKGGKVDDILVYNRELTPLEIKSIAHKINLNELTEKPPAHLSKDELHNLKSYYLATQVPKIRALQDELKEWRTKLADSVADIPELMIMQESKKSKRNFVLIRGNYDSPGEEVFPNTPSSILSFPQDLPRNRYGLAQWLTRSDHPLTSRVAVNRLWQNFFGFGLVKTAEDFGNQGEMPSHPQLLDWLAVTFMESGWDLKKMSKLIVMSATYQQDSRAGAKAKELDPENRLLSHGPVNRLTAEMLRDNALMASGLLNKQIGGKSVKPYQPEGLWEINSDRYTPDHGDALYRRSLYIIVKRSVPNPTLSTFDATSRSYCVVRRQQTNTPLQALVTLNDPTFVEAAKVLGEQMIRNPQPKQAIIDTYRKLTGKQPQQKEIELLQKLQELEYEKFKKQPQKAIGWLNSGEYQVDKNLDTLRIAANAVVASTILNSDASLTKR